MAMMLTLLLAMLGAMIVDAVWWLTPVRPR